jgi:hypothetical protein
MNGFAWYYSYPQGVNKNIFGRMVPELKHFVEWNDPHPKAVHSPEDPLLIKQGRVVGTIWKPCGKRGKRSSNLSVFLTFSDTPW